MREQSPYIIIKQNRPKLKKGVIQLMTTDMKMLCVRCQQIYSSIGFTIDMHAIATLFYHANFNQTLRADMAGNLGHDTTTRHKTRTKLESLGQNGLNPSNTIK